MKALLISFEFGPLVAGGLGRVINGVTDELRHQLQQLDVFLLYYNSFKLGMSAKLFRCDDEHTGRLVESFVHGSAEEQCAKLIAREGYDVVHVLSVNASIGKLLAALERYAPEQAIVYSVHNLVKHEQGTRKNPAGFLGFERAILQRASVIHVLNRTTRVFLERAYPDLASHKAVRVVGNGVSSSGLDRYDDKFELELRRRLEPARRTFVCLSRWAHGKGLEHFVAAAERLLAEGHDAQFVLAGRKYLSWEKQWYAYVWRISQMSRRVGERLLVLGWLNEAQRNTLYRVADACVMPSELEYYPYSVLEPAVAGVPLVCSDLPCVSELLADGEECLLFRSGDSQSLAGALSRFMKQPELGPRLAERARAKVLARCEWRAIAKEYLALYREAAGLGSDDWEAA